MMSSTTDEDPFLQVQQDVISQLSSTRSLFSSYLRIRSLSTSASSPELIAARSDLESALSSLVDDLADLVASVQAVESNPAQYGLSTQEVSRRSRLVQDVGAQVDDMRDELTKVLDASTSSQPPGASSSLPDANSFAVSGADADDPYAEFEQTQQVEMMRQQDEHLDGVFQTVGSLRRQADDMGRELEEQHEMLEIVDNTATRVGSRLQNGMQKLQYVMRKNEDRWSSCCIALLIFVLILLLVLLLLV
ncbi:hypothetical protein CDD81_7747 [Ophiocordyceps australis]|uniref:t-SNARE affecting a late Golgi compartment protein 1 n=1 Tax=Ophiocordyceps australis TaxID=1399860 RepID=A0A2C5Y2L4_9HYPO|nr:hypothetical protein CDD81_7747 [Ophiocordyceps australis]